MRPDANNDGYIKERTQADRDPETQGEILSGRHVRKMLLMSVEEDGQISPSKVAQKYICAATNGRYPVSNSYDLFESASKYGFGKMVDVMTPTRPRVKKFRKKPYDRLDTSSIGVLQKLRITQTEYEETFCSTPTPELGGSVNPSRDYYITGMTAQLFRYNTMYKAKVCYQILN